MARMPVSQAFIHILLLHIGLGCLGAIFIDTIMTGSCRSFHARV